MMVWPITKLPEVAQIIMGQSPPGDTYNEKGDGLPFFQGKAEFGEINPLPKKWCNAPKKIAEVGDILMSVRAPVGPTNIASTQCCIGRGLAAIRAIHDKINPAYLRYILRFIEPRLACLGQGSTFAAIGRAELAAIKFPLPPLAEQRSIVDILSRAEGIVRLRREAQKKAAEIIPALFIDMFGDPATNPKRWPITSVGQLASYTRYGPRFPDRQYADEGAHILRTTDMGYNGELRWFEAPILPMSSDEIEKYSLKPKTLLITRTGATIGKTALFNGSDRPCIAGAYLIEVGLNTNVIPEFVLHFFLGQFGQSQLIGGSRAVAQPNINAPTIRAIPIFLPDLTIQKAFADQIAKIESIQTQQSAATKKAEAAFNALLAKFFS